MWVAPAQLHETFKTEGEGRRISVGLFYASWVGKINVVSQSRTQIKKSFLDSILS